ncbi:uncharacterized protein TRAVEDRAFT_75172 [Trametes versicolor FP-101664 SS1]|uniref:uncharacterized protein n=1 Tax=Trametes versicolor (strain FP-101664) TaxID=717944 RepID=UPI0004621B4A|nr:uncharacterized protein TRAVEDRAFT_75172 [Trametes versicolor FP-101664 SS1]EIW52950.1 hypothetical protein TRAVEDRAFT_75172 [Trametes versicolor FP-101664 SS1]
MSTSLKQQYDEQGFVIVPNLIPPAQFAALESASERVITRTRTGQWPHRRTVGAQFPPYGDGDPDSWGVQHVMHPDLGEPAFARWYTSDALVGVVRELLGCGEEDLQMELFNMLINPTSNSFALRWHRDDVRENATEDEEREALSIWHHGTQWNTALREDSCLYVVPGSHKVPRTPAQRALSSTLDPPTDPLTMPGAIRVALRPGETVFYNNNILHCAAYDAAAPRITLHACMGEARGGPARARNILQHGLRWMKEPPFADTLDARGRAMLERIVRLQESVGGEVGYSLAN